MTICLDPLPVAEVGQVGTTVSLLEAGPLPDVDDVLDGKLWGPGAGERGSVPDQLGHERLDALELLGGG